MKYKKSQVSTLGKLILTFLCLIVIILGWRSLSHAMIGNPDTKGMDRYAADQLDRLATNMNIIGEGNQQFDYIWIDAGVSLVSYNAGDIQRRGCVSRPCICLLKGQNVVFCNEQPIASSIMFDSAGAVIYTSSKGGLYELAIEKSGDNIDITFSRGPLNQKEEEAFTRGEDVSAANKTNATEETVPVGESSLLASAPVDIDDEPDFTNVRVTHYYTAYEGDFEKWFTGYPPSGSSIGYCGVPMQERGFYESVKCQGSGVGLDGKIYKYLDIQPEKSASVPWEGCPYCTNAQTGSGTDATPHRTIAVDPSLIPYGTVVYIKFKDCSPSHCCEEWNHKYVAEDAGGAIKGNHIDLYVGVGKEQLNAANCLPEYADIWVGNKIYLNLLKG